MIDLSKVKPGDTVTICSDELVVTGVLHDDGLLTVRLPDGGFHTISPRLIASHTPAKRVPKVGDKVRVKGGEVPRTVIAVHKGYAWIDSDTWPLCTWPLDKLVVVEDEQ